MTTTHATYTWECSICRSSTPKNVSLTGFIGPDVKIHTLNVASLDVKGEQRKSRFHRERAILES